MKGSLPVVGLVPELQRLQISVVKIIQGPQYVGPMTADILDRGPETPVQIDAARVLLYEMLNPARIFPSFPCLYGTDAPEVKHRRIMSEHHTVMGQLCNPLLNKSMICTGEPCFVPDGFRNRYVAAVNDQEKSGRHSRRLLVTQPVTKDACDHLHGNGSND